MTYARPQRMKTRMYLYLISQQLLISEHFNRGPFRNRLDSR